MSADKALAAKLARVFADWDDLSGEERIRRFMDKVAGTLENETQRFDTPLFAPSTSLKLTSIDTPTPTTCTVKFTYQIPYHFTNRMGNLHGGAAATIFDDATTLALAPISRRGFWMLGGVSRGLNVRYLRPVKEGERVVIVCEVVHAGKQMAALRGSIIRESDGTVLTTCEHDKVNTDPPAKAKL